MKNISILRTIINIFYWLLALSFGVTILSILGINLAALFTSSEVIIFPIRPPQLSQLFLINILPLVILNILFIIGVYHLRATIPLLHTGNLFVNKVSSHFSVAGKLFSTVGILGILYRLILPLLISSKILFPLEFTIICCVFLITIGLFFLFFGEVFQRAKAIQEENELTI